MKKFILFLLFVGAVGGGYYLVKTYARLNISVYRGKTTKAIRGDLEVPITASGTIQPASVTQIKSKASGEVIDIRTQLGAMVTRGQLLIKLLDVDERRNVEQREADHKSAEIALKTAQINLDIARTATIRAAQAKLEQAKARQLLTQSTYEFFLPQTQPRDGLPPTISPHEWRGYLSQKLEADAAVLAAEAELERAKAAIELAEQDVENARERLNATQAALDDARERLRETNILSPVDGMVLDLKVREGEVVQSGKTMFTGGTVLMEIADVNEIFAVVNVDEADIGKVRELAPPSARPGTATKPAEPVVRQTVLEPDSEGRAAGDAEAAGDDSPGADTGTPADTQPARELVPVPPGTLEVGQTVKVKIESFPDDDFEGVITLISPQSEVIQAVATFKVWIKIVSDNVDKLVGLLNTQAEAHFTVRAVQDAVLVDYDAVQQNPNGSEYGVYIPVNQEGALYPEPRFKPCKFGDDNGIYIEVREGLEEGEEVYTQLPRKRDEEN